MLSNNHFDQAILNKRRGSLRQIILSNNRAANYPQQQQRQFIPNYQPRQYPNDRPFNTPEAMAIDHSLQPRAVNYQNRQKFQPFNNKGNLLNNFKTKQTKFRDYSIRNNPQKIITKLKIMKLKKLFTA